MKTKIAKKYYQRKYNTYEYEHEFIRKNGITELEQYEELISKAVIYFNCMQRLKNKNAVDFAVRMLEWDKKERDYVKGHAFLKGYYELLEKLEDSDKIIANMYQFRLALFSNIGEEFLRNTPIEEKKLMISTLKIMISELKEEKNPKNKEIKLYEKYISIIQNSLENPKENITRMVKKYKIHNSGKRFR